MKSRPFSITSLILAAIPILVVLLNAFIAAYFRTIIIIIEGLALALGITGIILGKKEADKPSVIIAIIGAVFALVALITIVVFTMVYLAPVTSFI